MIDIGKVGEYQFATELLKRGFVPLWPSAEALPYDLVYLNHRAEAVRVQVKASMQTGRIDLNVAHGKNNPYTKTHIDLLVVWAMAVDRWYLIPVDKVTKSMSLNPTGKRCKWREFKDAWEILS